MKKLVIALIIVIAAVAAWYVLAPVSPAPVPSVSASLLPTATPVATQTITPTPTGVRASVEIADFAFSPASLTVNAGTTVTWTNHDSVAHQLQSDSGSAITSDLLQQGDTVSVTFSTPGTYAYHCSVHPTMKGTVIVQ